MVGMVRVIYYWENELEPMWNYFPKTVFSFQKI